MNFKFVLIYEELNNISTESILKKHNLLSVNQINAQMKLNDLWKASNIQNYPTKLKIKKPEEYFTTTRSTTRGDVIKMQTSRGYQGPPL